MAVVSTQVYKNKSQEYETNNQYILLRHMRTTAFLARTL